MFTFDGLPSVFWLVALVLVGLVFDALHRWRQPWSIPALAVYGTAGAWYLIDVLYNGIGEYRYLFPPSIINAALWQVALFLLVFRLVIPGLSRRFTKKVLHSQVPEPDQWARSREIQRSFQVFVWVWVVVFIIGQINVGFRPLDTLFPPLAGRQIHMWDRPRIGGGFSFFISSCGYLYTFICAFFGIVAVLSTRTSTRVAALVMMLISWPNFFWSGTRHNVLAVIMPAYACYILYFKHNLVIKVVVSVVLFLCINWWMLVMIAYRGEGIVHAYQEGRTDSSYLEDTRHLGLNMFEELCWINHFIAHTDYEINYGERYFAEAVNWVPRAIWKNKPLIGIDYAIMRGQAGGTYESAGVFATISTGMIGQGVTNFGIFFGPAAAAVLMAIWASILSLFRIQESSIFRTCLFLIGLGLTFNLGRDITLLVVFPFVFGFLVILYYEKMIVKRSTPKRPMGLESDPKQS